MSEPRHTSAIRILRVCRDWKKPKVPHSSLIILLSLDDAPEGMTSAGLACCLGRPAEFVSKPMDGLIKSGLVDVAPHPHRKGAFIYLISELGKLHLDEILNPKAVPA